MNGNQRNSHETNRGTVIKIASIAEKSASALNYDRYLQAGTEEQQRRWTQVYDLAGCCFCWVQPTMPAKPAAAAPFRTSLRGALLMSYTS